MIGVTMSAQEPMYYIQNKGFVGNSLLWWRENGNGYTCNLNEAWKVTKEKAQQICKTRPAEDIPHLVSFVDAHAQRHVVFLPKQ